MTSTLSIAETKQVYDTLGRMVDWTKFYEKRAINKLIEHSNFENTAAVLEFGCGTGRLAQRLLEAHLPTDARYMGIDISSTMVRLATRRLQPWDNRAEIVQGDGHLPNLRAGSYDRLLSTFVFDLLDEANIADVIQDAHRLLKADGLMCLASLSRSSKGHHIATWLWEKAWQLSPRLVAGCRPIDVHAFLPPTLWKIVWSEEVSILGLTSSVLVAKRLAEKQH